jgi:hypothetical protein
MGSRKTPMISIPLKSWIIALVLGGGLFASILLLIVYNKPTAPPVGMVTAALTVIPSSHHTQTPVATEKPPEENNSATSTLEPGTIGLGAFVQVSGTGGDGLRLRKGPGLNNEMQFLGLEGELFQVGDGPVDADGYIWWFVVGSYDETRQGWAAADFLALVPNPE